MNQEKWSLRPATEDDLPKLWEMEKRIHASGWNLEHFAQELKKPYAQLWVMTDDLTDLQIAGFVAFWEIEPTVEILNLGVGEPYRRFGFGEIMVRSVLKMAFQKPELDSVRLDVRVSNLAALSLYQKVGFQVLYRRKKFYSDGEDGFHLVLERGVGDVDE